MLLVVITACNNVDDQQQQISVTVQPLQDEGENNPESSNGYPSGESVNAGYPGNNSEASTSTGYPGPDLYENLLEEPPNPDIDLPAASEEGGVIGGVLVREVVGYGFEPLVPASLMLAEVLLTTDGRPAFIRAGSDSPKAQLYPTGIFIFQNIPPGEYGLMVDVGYTIFPINNEDGTPLLIKLDPGGVIDMGQIITELPSS
ncbi:MAG TPA: hypothetical protein PLD25_10350 [Chloroflexota bacterium]|nr:hypothetical protein [Chloroflexota bacterium]HUM67803.1 hypothetical protein [Chloroflexota bacterium]